MFQIISIQDVGGQGHQYSDDSYVDYWLISLGVFVYIYTYLFQIISILEMSVDQDTSILMILMLIIGSFL